MRPVAADKGSQGDGLPWLEWFAVSLTPLAITQSMETLYHLKHNTQCGRMQPC